MDLKIKMLQLLVVLLQQTMKIKKFLATLIIQVEVVVTAAYPILQNIVLILLVHPLMKIPNKMMNLNSPYQKKYLYHIHNHHVHQLLPLIQYTNHKLELAHQDPIPFKVNLVRVYLTGI